MELGYIIGWVGVLFGLAVPVPQLIKIIRTKSMNDVSMGTYIFLCLTLTCYLIHAIWISAPVFIVAQSLNLVNNTLILGLLVRGKMKGRVI